ncbi:cobalt-precorrin-6A reductase [Lampropedia puyangensis]|uniref:Cobalt-precorrin-6A reductase n=1 Tax=Lampropedia puyangensis TaxID=1330072 RepID=A0A4S8F3S7_9BURK|nr:cobalt-precorrin-6A reductase [Lampropedia puyangensis]THU02020.1 cobalt-precorrin-6A reductase [Lampropedia puyangensis]
MIRILLLGGTSGANQLAVLLHAAQWDAVYSYAGVTRSPRLQPLPTRVGGFGGVEGLAQYIRDQGIGCVLDATHPFAERMSRHAIAACAQTGTPLVALQRAAWQAQAGDRWHSVPDMAAAVAALPAEPQRIFLGIGRKALAEFSAAPQHHYVLRVIDSPDAAWPLPDTTCVVARGPFSLQAERSFLQAHGITWVVSKNAGAEASYAKLEAARALGLPVVMVQRPPLPARQEYASVEEVMAWLATHAV